MRRLLASLGIGPADAPRAGWLFAHSLCIGLYTSFSFTAVNSLFLSSFEEPGRVLPWIYITAAVLGILVVRGLFRWLRRRLPFAALLVSYPLFVFIAVSALGFGAWSVAHGSEAEKAMHFLLFAFWTPSLTLLTLGFSSQVLRLLDLRQSKRLFALVSTGEVLSSIVGFFLVPFLTPWLGGPLYLLPVALGGPAGAVLVLLAMRRRFAEELCDEARPAAEADREKSESAPQPAAPEPARRDSYFVFAAVLMGISVLTLYLVDFSFLNQLKAQYGERDKIAGFIGFFFGTVKILELLFKTFFSGRLLERYGLRVGLVALPGTLGVVTVLTLLVGHGVVGGGELFFLLVALSKLVWLVVYKSVFDPSFKVLYQPLPASSRLGFQSTIEGVVRLSGLFLTGFLLLFLSRAGVDALVLTWLLVPVLVLWSAVVAPLYRGYRKRLQAAISHSEDRPLVTAPLDALFERLRSADLDERQRVLSIVADLEPAAAQHLITRLVDDGGLRLSSLRSHRRLQSLSRRIAASRYAWNVFSGEEHSASELTQRMIKGLFLEREQAIRQSRSPRAEEREQAALAIGAMREKALSRVLKGLLWDYHGRVRRVALAAAGQLGVPQLWPRILAHLSDPAFASEAATTIEGVAGDPEGGERILDDLEIAFGRTETDRPMRLRILGIYSRLTSRRAQELLVKKLRFPDKVVREKALEALVRRGFRAEGSTAADIREVIRRLGDDTVWDLTARLDLGADETRAQVCEGLTAEIEDNRALLFQLLSLLYDPQILALVRDNLERGTEENLVYAVEILEILLDEELRPYVLPLAENLPPAQVRRRWPSPTTERLQPRQRLATITWRSRALVQSRTQTMALEALAASSPAGTVPPELLAHVFHCDRLLQEVAARGILRLDPPLFEEIFGWLPEADREHLNRVFGKAGRRGAENWRLRSVLGRVELMEEIEALAGLPWRVFRELAACAEERFLGAGRLWPPETEHGSSISVVVTGAFDGGTAGLQLFGPGLPRRPTASDTQLLHWNSRRLRQLASDHHLLLVTLLGFYEVLEAAAGAGGGDPESEVA